MSAPDPMQGHARWPWIGYALFVSVAVGGSVLVVANGESFTAQVSFIVAFSMMGFVGALILSRDRRNTIGGMLLWASMVTAISFGAGELFTWLGRRGQDGTALVILAFLNTAGWLFGIMPTIFLLPLLFPDGKLPTRRWRPFVWAVAAFLGLLAVWLVFGTEELSGSNDAIKVANPLHVSGFDLTLDPLIGILYPLLFGLSVLSLVLRFRRTRSTERQQIRWVVFGLLLALVGTVVGGWIPREPLSSIVTGAAFAAFPVSIGISVLQYRLYDLDVVVKKALIAGTIALIVIVAYVGLVSLAGAMTTDVGSGAVFVVALALGVAFRPVAGLARRVADRIVYGTRATPYEVLTSFGDQLAGTYSADDVLLRTANVLGEGVGAERARVWLRVGDELRVVAMWPGDAAPGTPDDLTVPVLHTGEELGALSVAMPANDPLDPAKEKLVHDLAAQAGPVLHNVRLTEELRARLEDLRAAQKRLVTAQDAERKRLERNIHDGAQQQLVALAVKLRLADTMVDRDPARAHEALAQLQTDTAQTLEDLRDLARGIYPPLLVDQGLGPALVAQARRSPVPVDVRVDLPARFPQEVEAAVYFSCLEGLQNVAKYAHASRASVRVWTDGADLAFEVVDDGRGFDPSANGYGTGLQGIADRLGALDGRVEVVSSPGDGTRVLGRLRVDSVGASS